MCKLSVDYLLKKIIENVAFKISLELDTLKNFFLNKFALRNAPGEICECH